MEVFFPLSAQERMTAKMAAPMSNVDEIRDRVILGEFGVRNVSYELCWLFINSYSVHCVFMSI